MNLEIMAAASNTPTGDVEGIDDYMVSRRDSMKMGLGVRGLKPLGGNIWQAQKQCDN